jgi:predicted ester cyclase
MTEPERNKETIRRLFAEVDRGDVDVADYYSEDYVDHTPSPIRGLAEGHDGLRQAFRIFRVAFPDTRHTVDDLVAEGDRVAARISARATHTGELFGHPPTGKVVTLDGLTLYRMRDGRIVERWAAHGLGIFAQLGIEPPARPR